MANNREYRQSLYQHQQFLKDVAVFDARRELTESVEITLNGQPAKITGYRKPFATVTDIATGLGAEWSWEAVANVVNGPSKGAFKS